MGPSFQALSSFQPLVPARSSLSLVPAISFPGTEDCSRSKAYPAYPSLVPDNLIQGSFQLIQASFSFQLIQASFQITSSRSRLIQASFEFQKSLSKLRSSSPGTSPRVVPASFRQGSSKGGGLLASPVIGANTGIILFWICFRCFPSVKEGI